MGAVYEVTHTETDRRCALKVMLPSLVSDPGLRARFKREAKVTAHINSEFIVDVLDAGVDEATEAPFIVMEYLEGADLAHHLENKGSMCPEEVVTYLWQAAMALQKTHAANIVHRDLKPENLFLTKRDDGSPRIKILDFGISKVMESSTQGNSTKTLGTPLYMAPEQFKGNVSPATDIYALGMIAFTLLVGQSYWTPLGDEDGSVWALAGRIMTGIPDAATARAMKLSHTIDPGFDEWFAKAVELDPKSRFPTAMDAIGALAKVFSIQIPTAGQSQPSLPPPAPHESPVARAATSMTSAADASQTQAGRSKTGMIAAIAIAVLATGIGGFLLARSGATPSTPPATGVVESVAVTNTAPPVASPSVSVTAPPAVTSVAAPATASATATATATATAAAPTAPAKTGGGKTPPKPGGGDKPTPPANDPYGRF